jgi:hypothetical protein
MMGFIEPYIFFCGSSTYSLIQNMESMGWSSFWDGIFIDPHSTFIIYFYAYLILLPVVALLSILASFSLNRMLGGLVVVLWILPGALSLYGVDVISVDTPDSYKLNSGSMYVGETRSTLYNVFICFLLGWSITTLLVHVFKISKNFKESYDHVWYVFGLAAAVIFVVDSNIAFYKTELTESESNISKTLSLITNQLNYTNSICLKNRKDLIENGISKEFCEWVDKAKFNYFWLSEDKAFTRHLKSLSDFDALVPAERLADISNFNDLICHSEIETSNCNLLPFELGRFTKGFEWPKSRFALAIVPLNDALKIFWEQSSKRYKKLDVVKDVPNTKWFFYMILGFIAGGKVANSSRTLAGAPKPIFRYWCAAVYRILLSTFDLFLLCMRASVRFSIYIVRLLREIPFNRWLQWIRNTN